MDKTSTDRTTSKIKGAVSKIGAAISGKPGILNTLEGEHVELQSLMSDLLASKSVDKQRQLYASIRQELLIHLNGEEQGLYPECKIHVATRELAEQAVRDHLELEKLLAALDEHEPGQAAWMKEFSKLRTAHAEHGEFEEKRLFVTAKDVIETSTLRVLDDRYKQYRKQVEARGVPLKVEFNGTP